jgi:hypothetical protein
MGTNYISFVTLHGKRWVLLVLLAQLLFSLRTDAQIDPEKRRLVQIGYNQPLQGRGPIAAYGFYFYNKPQFINTNMTLRLAVAPIYLDSELGFSGLLGQNTDAAIGLAGGGYADTYSEIRGGKYLKEESFTGHGGGIYSSVYHLFNPEQTIPLYAVGRIGFHSSIFERDSETAPGFSVPDQLNAVHLRTGLRFGGKEPTINAPLGMELSLWYEGMFRMSQQTYGFAGDRNIERTSHLIWGRAALRYTSEENGQSFDVGLTMGASANPDRFSAYRLGGVLPLSSEFPLSIPGYYYQELSAERFALLNAQYSFPITPSKNWSLTVVGATGPVDYIDSVGQSGNWHSGIGGGISFSSPSRAWFVSVIYGHGFDSIRSGGRGSDQVGLMLQYDFEAKRSARLRRYYPGITPYGSRAGERLFR